MFKRSAVHYGKTPEPVTPYQKAAQVWDERIGAARVQATNWRLMALGCLGLSFALGGGLIWATTQSRIIPYVVEVASTGDVRDVGPALEPYTPSDAQIAYHLADFITHVRSLSVDPIVVRQNWLKAYDYATDRAAKTLNEFARETDPFGKLGERTVSVDVTSVVRASSDSFEMRWIERAYQNGALEQTTRFTAVLSLIIESPRDVTALKKNPLGLYVHDLNWSQDFIPGDTP